MRAVVSATIMFVFQLLLVILYTCVFVVYGQDLTLEPGHLKPFGEGRPSYPVEEVDKFPNPKHFFENYVKPLKPLKMVGAAKYSPAFKKWTDDYFLQQKDAYRSMISSETVKKEDRNQEVKQMPFANFVQSYNDSEIYMVDGVPEFLRDDVMVPCPLQCETVLDDHVVENVMWFSSGGTKSVVHTDSVDNINCLYRGQKTLIFIDPKKYGDKVDMDKPHGAYCNVDTDSVDYTKYPGLAEVEFFHVTLEAGDCLYIPYKWIHQVRSFGSNLAVNIWWRHHLTQDINYKHCTDPCDPGITLNEVDFRGFDDTFMKLQPEEAREHLLSMTRAGSNLTWEDFLDSLHEDGFALAEALPELRESVQELFGTVDLDKDGVVTRKEITEAPNEVYEQALPILKDIFDIINEAAEEAEGEIDIDGEPEDDMVDTRDPDESDRADLHDEL